MNKRILHLNLKRKWFDLIKSGEKTEEYREIKEYWACRLLWLNDEMEYLVFDEMVNDLRNPLMHHGSVERLMEYFCVNFRDFDIVRFKNGYAKNADQFDAKVTFITIKQGVESWGAETGKYYFAIGLELTNS